MDYQLFYRQLFEPLEALLGPIDKETIVAIIGFDVGGPLNFCTIGAGNGAKFTTYVSCELAARPEQLPARFGRYELSATCDDETWVRRILTRIGRTSEDVVFGHHHTLDIAAWVSADEPIQGVVLEKLCTAEIDGENYGILRCIGITRGEMEFKQMHGSNSLILELKHKGVYPNTEINRKSVL
ncbi:MAG TPA: suppressor of fused domain protein [Gemmataceae bacterium]|nr:suppressor of fused domain protein [Gemmataceae bacterium]